MPLGMALAFDFLQAHAQPVILGIEGQQLGVVMLFVFSECIFSSSLEAGKFFLEGCKFDLAPPYLAEGSIHRSQLPVLICNSQPLGFCLAFVLPFLLELVELVEDGFALLEEVPQALLQLLEIRRRRGFDEVVVAHVERTIALQATPDSSQPQDAQAVPSNSCKEKAAVVSQL